MAGKPKYYLETSVVMELIEQPRTAPICQTLWGLFEDAQNGHCELLTSTITMLEVLWAKSEADKRRIDPTVSKIIEYLWHPASSPIQIIPCHEAIARDALGYFRKYFGENDWSGSRGPDLAHLVTAKREQVDEFFTADAGMSKWQTIMGFKVCAPHRLVAEETPPLFPEKKPDETIAPPTQ